MAKARVEEAVITTKNFLKSRNIRADKVFIFGSYAKGAQTRESDIDIAIVSRDFDGRDIFQKTKMIKGLNWLLVEKFMRPFDIIPVSFKEWQRGNLLF